MSRTPPDKPCIMTLKVELTVRMREADVIEYQACPAMVAESLVASDSAAISVIREPEWRTFDEDWMPKD